MSYIENEINKLETKAKKLNIRIKESKLSILKHYRIHKFLKIHGKLLQLKAIKNSINFELN